MEFLKTYTWQNALRGGVLRDVYALLYQLEHDTRRKNPLQVSIAYMAERLGYSTRNIQRALVELKEMGLVQVEYTDGGRSVYKTRTHDKLSPPEADQDPRQIVAPHPRQIVTPDKLSPLTDCRTPHDKLSPPTPIIKSKDSLENYSSSSSSLESAQSAREILQKWVAESDIQQWSEMLIRKSELPITLDWVETEFFNNDFSVREGCEQRERTAVLKHFQNWLPKYLRKLKTENDNANTATNRPSTPSNAAAASRAGSTSLDDIARSIAAGFAAGAARRE